MDDFSLQINLIDISLDLPYNSDCNGSISNKLSRSQFLKYNNRKSGVSIMVVSILVYNRRNCCVVWRNGWSDGFESISGETRFVAKHAIIISKRR